MRWLLIRLVRFYQLFISPFFPPSCRFEPTCSHYAIEAIQTYGALKGGWMALKRIGRCHPFCEGGFDPVPEADSPAGTRPAHKCSNHPVNSSPLGPDSDSGHHVHEEPNPVASVDRMPVDNAATDANKSEHPINGHSGHNITNPPN